MEVTKKKEREEQGRHGNKPGIDPAVIEELSRKLFEKVNSLFIRAGSFSFGLYCWPLGEAAAVGGALARRVGEAVDGTPARRVEEEPGVLGGPPVVVRVVSESAAGQEVYVQPGAEEPEYAVPVAAAF